MRVPMNAGHIHRRVQIVLQDKPREMIVRELQRTNLNVNQAVNNLLSRDDDEGLFLLFSMYSFRWYHR